MTPTRPASKIARAQRGNGAEKPFMRPGSLHAPIAAPRAWPAATGIRQYSDPGQGQVQRRTLTPLTMVVLQTLPGFRTTTAPRGPAQPARTTPSAQTTALAVRDSRVMVAPKASR